MILKFKSLKIFICIMIIAMMSADLLSSFGIPLLDNADEITGIAASIGVAFYIFYRKKISKSSFTLLALLTIFVCIGFLGNILSEITQNFKYILMDGFLFIKPYIIFLFVTMVLTDTLALAILNILRIISKLMLWLLAFTAILSRYIYTFMLSKQGTFVFFSDHAGTISWWSILFLFIIWKTKKTDREVICYMVLTGVVTIFSQSGLGMIAYCLGIILFIFSKTQKKIKWYSVCICIVICIIFGKNEINDYLLNNASPRAILLKYAFVTANTYFPLGSGFATYGSSAAIRDYSALYYQYGFNQMDGMTEAHHPYLMDNYYQQIIGQLGYVGFILLLWFMYKIVKKILDIKLINVRSAALMLYSCLIFAGIAFGTASSWGCTVYIMIPIFSFIDRKLGKKESKQQ